jgi:hypothetical protein
VVDNLELTGVDELSGRSPDDCRTCHGLHHRYPGCTGCQRPRAARPVIPAANRGIHDGRKATAIAIGCIETSPTTTILQVQIRLIYHSVRSCRSFFFKKTTTFIVGHFTTRVEPGRDYWIISRRTFQGRLLCESTLGAAWVAKTRAASRKAEDHNTTSFAT